MNFNKLFDLTFPDSSPLNDIEINGVRFNSLILQSTDIDFFEGIFRFNKMNNSETKDIEIKNPQGVLFSEAVIRLFKKWFYYKEKITVEDINDLDPDDVFDLYHFSTMIGISLFRDIQIKIEDRKDFIELYILGLPIIPKKFKFSKIKDLFRYCKQSQTANGIFLQGVSYEHGLGCDMDEKTACELYKQNWRENDHSSSLNNYALCLQDGIGCDPDEKTACELYKQNWRENDHSGSLNNYAYCLAKGIGCERDEKTACELYKQNWRENGDTDSLDNYAYCLQYGLGCERDIVKANELKTLLEREWSFR